ncbi:putative zinc metalloproteinase C607.06c [Cimex lectularius]|uniref:Zinc metalloproteinase n=1 Tax=Cimex lectularius TaxID=79782 RepID=A0A8I6S1N5_CIMLE|nr:putative zinc metalloproteinase C607.06c [Cimex lectularius]
MEIKIHDWDDNETVNHNIILIKGAIACKGQTLNCEEGCKLLCRNDNAEGEWPVVHGSFKCLAKLKQGSNRIILEYKTARKQLDINLKYNETKLCICPVYIVCKGHDGRFQAPPGCDNSIENACKRIALGLNLVQCVFAEKLHEQGFGRKSFQLETDLYDGVPECHVFRSDLSVDDARKWDEQKLWEYFGRELMCSELGDEHRKYLVFLSCTYWDGSSVSGDPALGGGGLALLGSACLHTWPTDLANVVDCFTSKEKIGPSLLDNSCFRGTYGGCYSTSFGSVCHEIGHMFNLGHSPTGIMSRGFDHIGRVFTMSSNQHKNDEIALMPCLSVQLGPSTLVKSQTRSKKNQKEDDMTHLTKSCATLLAHHKWFNNDTDVELDMRFDSLRNVLTSENGLKVVQLRASCGAVLKSWELGSKSPHKHLILPRTTSNTTSLVAMDANGNILSLQI